MLRRPALGLTAFLALDDTRLGPAAGGIRWRAYATPEDGALDVLRLARAMTYKNAFAELDLGGGKRSCSARRGMRPEAAFPALGELIESLGGRYITACDYGTTAHELGLVKSRTRFALAEEAGGALDLGTATGVLVAIRAVWRRVAGTPDLERRTRARPGRRRRRPRAHASPRGGGRASASRRSTSRRAEMCCAEVDAGLDAASHLRDPMDVFAPCAVGEVITEEVARRLAGAGHRRRRQQSARQRRRRAASCSSGESGTRPTSPPTPAP